MKTYVNLGCGPRFHPEWTNIDIRASSPAVIQHDLSRGIPFPDGHFEVVYHSAVLEHIRRVHVPGFMAECFRVLRPGGVIRIAVPDLERICRTYLAKLEQAMLGDAPAALDYDWMMLELIDQMVREKRGGEMARYLSDPNPLNREFVIARIGAESGYTGGGEGSPPRKWEELRKIWRLGRRVALAGRKLLLNASIGRRRTEALDIGLFRVSGEVHQWMYDRFSLQRLLLTCGFVEPTIQSARVSRIANWNEFELDALKDGSVLKPDLLVMEAIRPLR